MARGLVNVGKISFVGGRTSFAKALIRSASPKVEAAADNLAAAIPEKITAIIGDTYGSRSGSRSRSKSLNSTSNFKTKVTQQGEERWFVYVWVPGDNLFLAKFNSLNYGTSPHPIYPKNTTWLKFPWPTESSPYVKAKMTNWTERGGKFGTHFYERGFEAAVAEFPTRL